MSCTWTNAGWNNETLDENGPLHYTSRGESIVNNAPIIHDSLMDFIENGEEFGYVFTSAGWTCYDTKTWPIHTTTGCNPRRRYYRWKLK